MPAPLQRLVVKLHSGDDDSSEEMARRASAVLARLPAGSRLVRPPSGSGRLVVELAAGVDVAAAVRAVTAVAAELGVQFAEADQVDRAT